MPPKILFYSSKSYDRDSFPRANAGHGFVLEMIEPHLNAQTAALADGYDVVCAFVNDTLDRPTLVTLKEKGVRYIAMRCAGYNNVDLTAAKELGLPVVRVPAYSPYAVAEHALALILTLSRKTHKAYNRVRDGNFLIDGLVGFDLHGKTVGVIGLGKIGRIFADMMHGMGCSVLAYDAYPAGGDGLTYVDLPELYRQSDIISLHCPLLPETRHMINRQAIGQMKPGVMLINTSRGALVETQSVIDGLKSGAIGYLGLDVYEEEADLFFEDLSGSVIHVDVFTRLLTFPNVLITAHQAFLTQEALTNIAETTLGNIKELIETNDCANKL